MEEDNEEEKVHEKCAVKSKADDKKKVVAKTNKNGKEPLRDKSAFEDDIMSLSSESDGVGLAPARKAKEEKPVQIDTSVIKAAATIKKAAKPRAKP